MALTLNDEQEAQLLDLIGLPAADPGETNVEDVLDTIADLAEEGTKATASTQAGGETPTGIAAAAKAAGLEVVDPSTLDDLRAQAAEGRRLAASPPSPHRPRSRRRSTTRSPAARSHRADASTGSRSAPLTPAWWTSSLASPTKPPCR